VEERQFCSTLENPSQNEGRPLYNGLLKMATRKHLKNAPITEGLIEIRVVPSQEITGALQIEPLYESLKDQYPDKKLQQEFRLEILSGHPYQEKKESRFIGYKLTSQDERQVVQAWLDRMTCSRLKPYETWENLLGATQSVWEKYAKVVRPETITRVATRFINTIEIPLPFGDFNEFLTSSPSMPPKLPQALSSFFTRVVIPEPKTGAIAIVTQSLESAVSPSVAPILLDIDVFVERQFESPEEVWAMLGKLREIKNLIFFESVTDKALEPYV